MPERRCAGSPSWRIWCVSALLMCVMRFIYADSDSTVTGRVMDPTNRVVAGAGIVVRNLATLVERTVATKFEGIFEIQARHVGIYSMQVRSAGFRLYTIESLHTEDGRTIGLEVHLHLGNASEEVTVEAQPAPVDGATTTVGHIMDS